MQIQVYKCLLENIHLGYICVCVCVCLCIKKYKIESSKCFLDKLEYKNLISNFASKKNKSKTEET